MISTTTAIWRRQPIATQFTDGIAIAFLAIAAIFLAPTVLRADPPLPGAVFTTNSNCSGVDLNIYASKGDVYLNGGPAHPGAASLPDGSYYVRVTDPSGACVLGTSVGGPSGDTPFVVTNGAANCIQLCAVLIQGPCPGNGSDSCGYNDTTNPGGEYKVWVSTESSFTNNSTKTDNFKVVAGTPPPPPDTGTLCVDKFYDANANGVFDGTDQLIEEKISPPTPGWEVFISGGLLQNDYVTKICLTVPTGSYTVSEAHSIIGNWIQTAALLDGLPAIPLPALADPVSVTVNAGESHDVLFGNTCLGAGGGLTLGFWSNKNGMKLETSADLAFLRSLNLVNANGSPFDPTTTSALSTWLLAATATNMANMLSAQLAAMELNVIHGFVSGSALVHTGGCGTTGFDGSFITINDLMAAANSSLLAHPVTKTAGTDRSYQECLKNALDNANNNLNFVEPNPAACGGFSFNN
jgi:hypothetical protein